MLPRVEARPLLALLALVLTPVDKRDLEAFLRSLTGRVVDGR